MSAHTLYDQFQRKSVMYCSTEGVAFGPLFNDADAAEFVDWLLAKGTDPRDLHASDLAVQIETWEDEFYAASGEEK